MKYIYDVADDDHGTVSVWETYSDAVDEMIKMAQDGNPNYIPVGVEGENENAWCDTVEGEQVRVERHKVGISWGW